MGDVQRWDPLVSVGGTTTCSTNDRYYVPANAFVLAQAGRSTAIDLPHLSGASEPRGVGRDSKDKKEVTMGPSPFKFFRSRLETSTSGCVDHWRLWWRWRLWDRRPCSQTKPSLLIRTCWPLEVDQEGACHFMEQKLETWSEDRGLYMCGHSVSVKSFFCTLSNCSMEHQQLNQWFEGHSLNTYRWTMVWLLLLVQRSKRDRDRTGDLLVVTKTEGKKNKKVHIDCTIEQTDTDKFIQQMSNGLTLDKFTKLRESSIIMIL